MSSRFSSGFHSKLKPTICNTIFPSSIKFSSNKLFVCLIVLFSLIMLDGCASTGADYKIVNERKYDPSMSYICTHDTGGVSPLYKPVQILVNDVILAEGDPISNFKFYPVAPGKHEITVKFKGYSNHWFGLSTRNTDYIWSTFMLEAGKFYYAQPTAFKPKPSGYPPIEHVVITVGKFHELNKEKTLNMLKY